NPDRIAIGKVTLFQPDVSVITYKGDDTSNFIKLINKFSQEQKEEKSDFLLEGNIEILTGKLLIQNQNLESHKQDWIRSENLNTLIEDFKLENNEIWANIKRMQFDALRKGENYEIKNFSGAVHYSDKEIRVDELSLQTADSDLQGHLVFSYNSNQDLKDFTNKVNWDLLIKDNSKVNLKDIRYFVDNFDKNNTIEVLGKVSGTLNDLHLNDFQLSGDGAFIAAKELRLLDMTDGENIIIDSESVKIKTSYQGLQTLLPTFIGKNIPDFINRFGTMDYLGNFNLDPVQINIDGYAMTGFGDADLKVRLDDYRGNLKYKGTVQTDDINLRQITEISEFGYVSGNLNFDGTGTDISTLKIEADGKLAYLDLMEKRYQNISLDGRLENQKFNGFLSVEDAQLNANYNGTFDFSKKPYQLEFTSGIKYLNLDYLGVTKNMQAKLRTDVKGDFQFSNLDDFLGEIKLSNLHFTSKNDTLDLAQAHIISSRNGEIQNLELDLHGYLKGEIHGEYKLSQLPDAIMNTIGTTTLLTYEPRRVDPNQNFNFYFEVEQDLFSMFDERIKVAPGTILDGEVDTNSNSLIAEM